MDTRYTQDQVRETADAVIASLVPGATATVVGLRGDLGAGKTTLVQALARSLGVATPVVSPTFVIAKFYETNHSQYKRLVHVDAYRIEDVGELEPLGFDEIIKDPNTLLVVEWPERIQSALPPEASYYQLMHHEDARTITRV